MSIEVKVPVLPESVADATIAGWHKKVGQAVKRDENLVDLETDKVVLEVPSPTDGVLKEIRFQTGDTVTSEQVLAIVEAGAAAAESDPSASAKAEAASAKSEPKPQETPAAKPAASSAADALSPAGKRIVAETGIDPAQVPGTGRGGRVTKGDLLRALAGGVGGSGPLRKEERVPMSRLRKRIADRMMESKNSIAMLTSFNEVDLKAVMDLRKQFKDEFEKRHGVRLGIMSFFVKAATEALKRFPIINAAVDGDDIVYHGYQDIGVAVATDRGLVVPVLRNTDTMSLADIEAAIATYAKKAREGGLSLEDLQGGTFTITNGGTFGSLMSTPIVNPPQSAILGMHTIKDRPVAVDGQVLIRPMMYVALSYDHRIIDGKDAVQFLVTVKTLLENPARMLLDV